MKNVLRIGSSVAISVVLGMFIVLVNMYLLKLDIIIAYIIGGVIGAVVGYLCYRIENSIFNVIRTTVLGWSIGSLVGLVYMVIFHPQAAQGIFVPIIWTGPIAGVAGFIFGIIVLIRQKKAEPSLIVE